MPFDPDEPWTCEDVLQSLDAVSVYAGDAGLLHRMPDGTQLLTRALTQCASCRGSGSRRACCGWKLELDLDRGTAIELAGLVGDQYVYFLIEGVEDYRQTSRGNPHHVLPFEGTFSVSVLDAGRRMLRRHHVDTANAGQTGSVNHFQLGGLASVGEKDEREWLDVPRWPMPRMSLLLVVELALYSLAPEKWASATSNRTWRQWIQRSEALSYSLWLDRFNGYWSTRSSGSTWLARQCNMTGPGWPRAAGRHA